MMTTQESLEAYQKDTGLFLMDFWNEGNKCLTILIEPRKDVESGRWYTASWLTRDDERRLVTAQWNKLLWERIIKQYLEDEAAHEERLVQIGMGVVKEILDENSTVGRHCMNFAECGNYVMRPESDTCQECAASYQQENVL